MRKIKFVVLSALMTIFGTMAFSPVWAQASSWQGFYGQVGTGFQQYNAPSTSGVNSGVNFFTIDSANSQSMALNLSAGFNYAFGSSFVLGLGAEYSPLTTSFTPYSYAYPALNVTGTSQWRIQNTYNVFLSPGWAIDDTKLVYAKVGITGTQKQTTVQTYDFTGYSLGLGYKQFIYKQLYAFGEVNYADYGTSSNSRTSSGTQSLNGLNVLIGVGYKF
jgi:opacity protein-like surface antigen